MCLTFLALSSLFVLLRRRWNDGKFVMLRSRLRDVYSSNNKQVKWIRISSFLCVFYGLLCVLFNSFNHTFWQRGVSSLFGLVLGGVGVYTLLSETVNSRKLFFFLLILFTILLGVGNIYPLYYSTDPLCNPLGDTIGICHNPSNEFLISNFFLLSSLLIFLPLCFVLKDFPSITLVSGQTDLI
eukprot:TRINITY_DN5786_c0_g1_i1.p1 TRINITY_DN5786_c0_g1~~TRINITY_DN5786_c0_g1_i1.p1  ORF type:complete len:183 (+),score=5.60 TRINITY_DN5786_c0_g1_i1:82-630(+)